MSMFVKETIENHISNKAIVPLYNNNFATQFSLMKKHNTVTEVKI